MPRPLVYASILILGLRATAQGDSPDPRLAGYRTPPGWRVELAATEPMVINPVTMTWGPDGRLYVVEWLAGRGPNDRIKVLTDVDGDGAFDKADIYMDGLDLPAGVLFWDGWTYVTLDHDVVRFKDEDGDGKFETRQVVASGFGNDDSHHRVSGMTIGPDGWLYLTTGDSDAHAKGSDGSTAVVLRSGGVFRCKPNGSKMEVVAFGMRNPWGNVAFDDEFRLLHTDNDNEGSPGFTGCRLLHVVEGGDYGWRLREGARCCQPDPDRASWNGGRPGRLGWMAETGRGAPAGLCVLNSAAFPTSTRNLVVYPDVFRKLVRAYRLKPAGATLAVAEEFELLASDDPLFRPDDAEIGPDGALYVLDWRTDSGGAGQLNGNGKTGRIYRLTWGGTDKEPAIAPLPRDRFAKLREGGPEALVEALSSPDYGLRRFAGLELIRRGQDVVPLLARLIEDPQKPVAARRQAVAAVSAVAPAEFKAFFALRATRDRAPSLRRLGYELIGRFAQPDDRQQVVLMLSLDEQDPHALRAAALALGRYHDLRRARPGENVDHFVLFRRIQQELTPAGPGEKPPPDEDRVRRHFEMFSAGVTTDMVAQALLDKAVESSSADPFLRDGFTRALERLGPAGLDALVNAVAVDGPRRRATALFALQGWRGRDAVDAILALATGTEDVGAEARVGLFRALREMGEAVPPTPIASWLSRAAQADPRARAEAVRVLTAMQRRAVLAAAPLLPDLLADGNAEVRKAALALAGSARSDEAKNALVELARRDDRSAEERRLAVAALRAYEDKDLAPTLASLFESSRDAGFRAELLGALAPLDFARAADLARKSLDSRDRDLRHGAIAFLGQRPETALDVVARYNAGRLPPEDLARVIEAVRGHATPELQAATQALLKNRLLAAPGGAEAERLREFVRRHGNPERGKALYLDAKKGGCATCHRMEGVGGAVGPDLTRVWQTLSFDKRVESILEPSKEIKEGYATYKVATTDGRVLTGLLLADKADGVTLRDAQGREVKVPAAEIDQKGNDPTSLMPAGVVGHLSFAELADLLAFLGDQRAQESLREKSP
jgi:quinoprotein glucose dehydrogenase